MLTRLLLAAGAALLLSFPAAARQAETLEFSGETWTVRGTPTAGTFRGVEALRLHRAGLTLADAAFRNGVIEYDLAMEPGNGFSAVDFRQTDDDGELIYFRHHLSGLPDSVQYTPTLNGLNGWQIYVSEGFWGTVDFPVGDWIRVRIDVEDDQALVSLDGRPVFEVPNLIGTTERGAVTIRGFGQTGSWVANITVTPRETGVLDRRLTAPEAPEIEGLLVERWRVSEAFDGARLEGASALPEDAPGGGTDLPVEFNGIANLARVATRTEETDTVIASAALRSRTAQTVMMRFGYSDRARVYLNGALLFDGDNRWTSRDYRYLGTITRHYSVPLRLEPGENRLDIAVSEGFGGWGVTAVLDEASGVTVAP